MKLEYHGGSVRIVLGLGGASGGIPSGRGRNRAGRPRSSGFLRPLLYFIITGLLALGPASVVLAAGERPERIDRSVSCVNADCHDSVADRPHLHWPEVAEPGQCQRCHVQNADRHDFETEDSPEACLSCHEALAGKIRGARQIHDAAEDGCIDCHDPHGGEVEALLVDVDDEDLSELCFGCHDEEIIGQEYTHGPAVLGACNKCHDPHASNRASLLLAAGLELCGGCHEELAELIDAAEYVHDPAEEDCTDCHNPHSGPYPKMLFAEKRELCEECHDDIVALAQEAAVTHDATTTGDECLSCHSPHASNHAPNLKKPQRDLCLDCHDRRVKSGDRWLMDMAAHLDENEVWHKPVLEDDCSGCHQPHGSANFRMLKKPFPSSFYTKFSTSDYGLCFSCHKKALATVESSRRVTGFRDGNRNLHFLHVNKGRRGRSCRACHAVHASTQPLHVRESTPFGQWLMPINFEKSEDGGSCRPGCHKRLSYGREGSRASDTD